MSSVAPRKLSFFLTALLLIVPVLALNTAIWGQAAGQPLTNATVIRMVTDKLPEAAIIARIQRGPDRFNLSPDGLVALTKAGVSKNILRVMMASNPPAQGATPSTPASSGNTAGTGSGPTPRNNATGGPRKPNVAVLTLKPGLKIKIAGGAQSSVSPTIAQSIQQQSLQAHAERTASPGTGGGTNPTGGTPAGQAGTQPGTPTGGSTPGATPGGGTTGLPVQRAGVAPTHVMSTAAAAPQTKLGQKAPQPISACNFATGPAITTVSGKNRGIVLTPDPGSNSATPNNQYSIRGCNFGQRAGEVHMVGAFINHASPLRLGIDSWTDNLIVATVDPTIQDEYDLSNITLTVVTAVGPQAQLPGQTFLATRASRPLQRIPQSAVTMPTTSLEKDVFVSPVTSATLRVANLTAPSGVATIIFFQYSQLWSSPNTSDGYPQNRISFVEFFDVGKLRPGFVIDPDVQTLMLGGPNLDNRSVGVDMGNCKFYDTPISASVQGNKLGIGVQPAECDNYGKFIFAFYGLNLSVTGPKGNKLDPWQSNL